jgi:hypothetical protein
VVPAAWQRRFAYPGDPGPYYRDLLTGKSLPAQGPGDKMSEQYANIVFDEYFRPSDKLEDRLSVIETRAIRSLDRTITTSIIDRDARVDLAYFLAIQACRYPEHFQRRLDFGKYLAISLQDVASCPDVATVNRNLQSTGLLPGAAITSEEFEKLKAASESSLAEEIDNILALHGYEAYFNAELVIAAALPAAEHLLALQWHLIKSDVPAFILCDRPMPMQIGYAFDIGLSASLRAVS